MPRNKESKGSTSSSSPDSSSNAESDSGGPIDERTQREGICKVSYVGPTGIVWVCVKKVHAKVYYRGKRSKRAGEMIFENNPGVDKHYFVNKYPRGKR